MKIESLMVAVAALFLFALGVAAGTEATRDAKLTQYRLGFAECKSGVKLDLKQTIGIEEEIRQ